MKKELIQHNTRAWLEASNIWLLLDQILSLE